MKKNTKFNLILALILFIVLLSSCCVSSVFAQTPLYKTQFPMVTLSEYPIVITVSATQGFYRPIKNVFVYAIDAINIEEDTAVFAFDTSVVNGCRTNSQGTCQIVVESDVFQTGREGWIFLISPNLELWMDVRVANEFLADTGKVNYAVDLSFGKYYAPLPSTYSSGITTGYVLEKK